MFNKNVIDVLSQIGTITNSIILKYPQTIAVSQSQDIQILVDISKLDDSPFQDIALNESLNDFLKLFKLFPEDRNVDISDNAITIKSDNIESMFIMNNIALMEAYDKEVSQFDKTEQVPSVATFTLTSDDIKNIKSASGVFEDLSEVIYKSVDGEMKVSLGATNRFNAKSNTFSILKDCTTSKDFEIKIPVANFRLIPTSDYQFDVKYNSARDSYRILMSNKSLEGFKILMAVKA